jgi:hypothetical protein
LSEQLACFGNQPLGGTDDIMLTRVARQSPQLLAIA